MDGSGKRLLVVDPGFVALTGHHYSTALLLGKACEERGVRCEYFASRKLAAACPERAPMPGIASLRCALSDVIYRFPYPPPHMHERLYEAFLLFGETLAKELEETVGPHAGDDAVILCHTATHAVMYAFARWLGKMPQGKRPHVLINFQHSMENRESDAALFAAAFAMLEPFPTVRVLGSDAAICGLLAAYSGKPSRVLPIPMHLPAVAYDKTGPPVFGVAGEARREKNLHIVPQAVRTYLETGGTGWFVIQLHPRDEVMRSLLVNELPRLRQRFPERVELTLEPLYGDSYLKHLARCDAVILPYPASVYKNRISQVVVECAALGTSCIVTRGSSMEKELSRLDNGSVFMPDATPADLTEALFAFERNLAENRGKAAAGGKICAAFHCAQTYLDIVFDVRDVYDYPDYARVAAPAAGNGSAPCVCS